MTLVDSYGAPVKPYFPASNSNPTSSNATISSSSHYHHPQPNHGSINHGYGEPPALSPQILQHSPVQKPSSHYHGTSSPSPASPGTPSSQEETSPATLRPRSPRIFAYPDGTFVMCLFKLALPIPFCQAPDSPCKLHTLLSLKHFRPNQRC